MSNLGFRNAVIGKTVATDPIWPVLSESNILFRKRNKQLIAAQASVHPVNNDSVPERIFSPGENTQISSSLSDALSGDRVQIENNFPELSKSVLMKKEPTSTAIKKTHHEPDIKRNPTNYNKKIRVPKFRNEICVSLSSLIKPSVAKTKLTYKNRAIKEDIFCGNKLDGDKPTRKKGKSRLIKKRYITRHKKDILLSRSLKKKTVYNQSLLKVKCLLPLKLNNLNLENLESLLESLDINEQRNESVVDDQLDELSFIEMAKSLLHSKKYRKYCHNLVTDTLLKNAENLVLRLRTLQDKQHAKDPTKTFAKRRYLCGFRETKRFILCNNVKAIIVATDLELDSDLPSGLPLNEIKTLAEEKSIPLIFAGRIKQLSYWTLKKYKISVISILRYEGAEELYNDLIESWEKSKKAYDSIIKEIKIHLPRNILSEKEILPNVEQEIRDNIISKLSKEMVPSENKKKE